jgi:hypothetical protein
MRKQHPLFIYDQREVLTLGMLAAVGAVFMFTLGLHMGKRLGSRPVIEIAPTEGKGFSTTADKVPNRQELFEQGRQSSEAAEKILADTLKEEVMKNQLRLEVPRQVELPDTTKSARAGATTLLKEQVEKKRKPLEKESEKKHDDSHTPSHSHH